MGRAKVTLGLITNNKKRIKTYQRRKKGMIKKAQELKTLCDVNVCMIICDPDNHHQEPEIFPEEQEGEVRSLIEQYHGLKRQGKVQTSGLSDFFEDRKNNAEKELAKAKKRNLEAKYPTWLEPLNGLSESQLRDFALGLGNKIDNVKAKIDLLKGSAGVNKIEEGAVGVNQIDEGFTVPIERYCCPANTEVDGFLQNDLNITDISGSGPMMMMMMMTSDDNHVYNQFCYPEVDDYLQNHLITNTFSSGSSSTMINDCNHVYNQFSYPQVDEQNHLITDTFRGSSGIVISNGNQVYDKLCYPRVGAYPQNLLTTDAFDSSPPMITEDNQVCDQFFYTKDDDDLQIRLLTDSFMS